MPPRNVSYHGGPRGRGRGSPHPRPGGRSGGSGRWSQPGCIPAGEVGVVLAAFE